MFNFDNLKSKEEYPMWYVRTDGGWKPESEEDSNEESFAAFQERPEYLVGQAIDTSADLETLITQYETLLVGCLLEREAELGKPELKKSRLVSILDWLRQTDMYTAPASTQYHESFAGGLLIHSLKVYNKMLDLIKTESFHSCSLASATLVALTHDWCKLGLYESYKRNVKNEQTGQWEQVLAYKYNQTGVPLGHGVSSMYLVSRFCSLTSSEALAIRWHMGEYRVCDSEMNELHLANERVPLVQLIQFADRLSITQY